MELVLTTHDFASIGGSETYLLTVAEHLERLGHGVTIHASQLGEMADLARDNGLRVARGERDLPDACDGVLAQDGATALMLGELYPGAPQVFVVHSVTIDLMLPPRLGTVTAAVAMNDRVRRRVESAGGEFEVVRLRQPIDLDRFAPRGVGRAEPRRVLMLGNYLVGPRRDLLVEACREQGLECHQAGRHGTATPEAHLEIGEADIVVGYGRSILEGMSSGKAVYVFDHSGGDGWVNAENYASLESNGFAGTATDVVIDAERLRRDLAAYDSGMGLVNRELIRKHHDVRSHAVDLVTLLQEGPEQAARADGLLAEMGLLIRAQWRAEGSAATVRLENELLRQRIENLEATVRSERFHGAEHLRAVEALQASRRYRIAQVLAKPLELVRRRRGS